MESTTQLKKLDCEREEARRGLLFLAGLFLIRALLRVCLVDVAFPGTDTRVPLFVWKGDWLMHSFSRLWCSCWALFFPHHNPAGHRLRVHSTSLLELRDMRQKGRTVLEAPHSLRGHSDSELVPLGCWALESLTARPQQQHPLRLRVPQWCAQKALASRGGGGGELGVSGQRRVPLSALDSHATLRTRRFVGEPSDLVITVYTAHIA